MVKRTAWFNGIIVIIQSWKLFTFFATVLIKLLCCSCNVFYSCLCTL